MNAEEQRGWLDEFLEKYKTDPEYVAEFLSMAATEGILDVMKKKGINQVELARRLGVGKSNISHLFDGRYPMTFRTFAKLLIAIGATASIGVNED